MFSKKKQLKYSWIIHIDYEWIKNLIMNHVFYIINNHLKKIKLIRN